MKSYLVFERAFSERGHVSYERPEQLQTAFSIDLAAQVSQSGWSVLHPPRNKKFKLVHYGLNKEAKKV